MNRFKNQIKSNYTAIPNSFINDTSLSWKAKGIFLYLASKPDDWVFNMDQIASMATDQGSALKTGVKELERAGYLRRERVFDGAGRIKGMDWILDLPSIFHQTENPPDGNSIGWKTMRHTNKELTNKENTNTEVIHISEKADWFIEYWNRLYDTKVRRTPKKIQQVQARLKTFKAEEIVTAMKNRSEDSWLNGQGLAYLTDWESFWRNDEKIERYLNRKQENHLPF